MCPYPTGSIILFSCRILREVLQVLPLGRDPGEVGLEVDVGDAEEGIASSQVKGVILM